MNVLSLFDGMSCGQIALTELGCFPEKYYLSDRAIQGMINHTEVNAEKGNGFGARVVSPDGKANTLLQRCYKDGKDNLIVASRGRTDPGGITRQNLEPRTDGKSNCLTTVQKDSLLQFNGALRRLTPRECARLQTVPDWYEWVVSDTQIYRMCGNGWTVRVIEHILGHLFI